jgi:hypothetical protein
MRKFGAMAFKPLFHGKFMKLSFEPVIAGVFVFELSARKNGVVAVAVEWRKSMCQLWCYLNI